VYGFRYAGIDSFERQLGLALYPDRVSPALGRKKKERKNAEEVMSE
jgi:hypothetical protein